MFTMLKGLHPVPTICPRIKVGEGVTSGCKNEMEGKGGGNRQAWEGGR